jgi:hypothetical protein
MQSNAWRGEINAAGQQSRILWAPARAGFLNCGENGPDDILKFP